MHPQFVWNKEEFVNMDNGSIICVMKLACAQCIELEFVNYSMLDTINVITMTFIGTNTTIVDTTITKVKSSFDACGIKNCKKINN